jgi:hypothetical protein
MSAELVTELKAGEREAPRALSLRVRFVRSLGPLVVLAGIVWAVAQPYRVTLLHPHGQGFWWLLAEPPIYVVLVGILFRFVVAPGLVEDLEE